MTIRLHWTNAADTRIRRLRAEGASWDAIAAELGVSRWSAIARGRHLGVPARIAPPPAPPPPDPNREPLPAGHPVTWGGITAGTLLHGVAYPWPPLPLLLEDATPRENAAPAQDTHAQDTHAQDTPTQDAA